MDTSVNMKMTPSEHRLIRFAVEELANTQREIVNDRSNDASIRAKAREQEALTRQLLTKL